MPPATAHRRPARQRPLNGVLITPGRRQAVVVTAHATRLVINIEADITAIPLSRVRRDDAFNLRRRDDPDWTIRLDAPPPPASWVHDLPVLRPPSRLRRVVLAVLALIGLLAGWLWLAGSRLAAAAA